jgi:hypothetical protein
MRVFSSFLVSFIARTNKFIHAMRVRKKEKERGSSKKVRKTKKINKKESENRGI